MAIVSLIICWFVSSHYFQLMLIQGDSMEPAYHNMQIVVLNKFDKIYSHSDVIAFRCEGLSTNLVKRIVGCPGDTVWIQDHKLLVNGIPYTEIEYAGLLETSVTLEAGQYIVLGDNIPYSKDSRHEEVGLVDLQTIIGAVTWPR